MYPGKICGAFGDQLTGAGNENYAFKGGLTYLTKSGALEVCGSAYRQEVIIKFTFAI